MFTYTIYDAAGLICGQFPNRSRAASFMRYLHRHGSGELRLVKVVL